MPSAKDPEDVKFRHEIDCRAGAHAATKDSVIKIRERNEAFLRKLQPIGIEIACLTFGFLSQKK